MVRSSLVRILLDYRPALRERTGVGEFVHELAKALTRTGTDDIILFTASWKDRISEATARELAGARFVDRRLPVRGLTWAWNRAEWPPAEWLAGTVDVVHAQSPLLIPTRGAAQVVTIHDLDYLLHPQRAEAEMRRDFPALAAAHAQRADQVIVSSRYAAAEVAARLGVARAKVSVCSPGVPEWASAIAAERAVRRISPGPILFLGTLEPRKNVGGLFEAYARLRTRRVDTPPLVMAGKARDSVVHELAKLREAPLAGHVELRGYISDAERQQLYRSATMLVLPSFEEGFGLPVLEAMACGLPVVVSDRGALPEVAGDAASPIPPGDADALAAAMERLLDPENARRASERGRSRAARYSWAACAANARDAYRAAVDHHGRRAYPPR
jgi:glycosyltransferase involved in cell wall biosynthesis